MSEQAAMSVQPRPTIADILLSHGFVDEEGLAAALAVSDRTGQPLGQVLVEAGAITRLELASALAEQWSDPGASITLLPRPLPQPPPRRSEAGAELISSDDTVYLGRLHDAVADLASRVSQVEPLLAELDRRSAESPGPGALQDLDARSTALAGQLDATLARLAELEGALGATGDQVEELTDGVEQAFTSLQAGMGELAERLAVIASIAETAPTSGDLVDVQRAVAELAGRPQPDETLGEKIEAVASGLAGAVATLTALDATVGEVAARPESDPALNGRLEQLEQRLASYVDVSALAVLQEAVADLAARPAVPAQVEQQLQELAARPEPDPDLPTRLDDLAALVEGQAVLYDAVATELRAGIEAAAAALPAPDTDTAERMDELATRIGELAAQVESLAAVAASGDDGAAVEELRDALEELGRRRSGDEETAARLDALAARLDELVARPEADPAVGARLDELTETVAALASDPAVALLRSTVDALDARFDAGDASIAEVGRRMEELAQRPQADPDVSARLEELTAAIAALQEDGALALLRTEVDEIRARLETDDTSLAELRAAAAELASRPAGDPDLAARLAALAARVDELAATPAATAADAHDRAELERLGTMVTSAQHEFDAALAVLAARLEALEGAPTPEPVQVPAAVDTAWADEAAKLAERLDALAVRVDEAKQDEQDAGVPVLPRATAPAEAGSETEQELERLRMAIERMSLHLGEQERAIGEVMRSRGTAQRLEELEARIEDVAAGISVGGGAPAADGTAAPAGSSADMRALVRRLDTAEAALEAERDKLLTKLERIASSLDWRMRRLEADDTPDAS